MLLMRFLRLPTVRKLLIPCVAAAVIAAISLATLTFQTNPARADSWVNACGPMFTQWEQTCVAATMGGKNYTNHTQWVGWVNVTSPRPDGVYYSLVKVEAWGDGFYFVQNSGSNASPTWGAQRWVRSGTYICGATTYSNGYRPVACIAVRV